MSFKPDPKSVASADLAVSEHTEVLVIGAGPAGIAAAHAAATNGRSVILVDENPVAMETMGEDVPLHFGQGMTGAVRNQNAMLAAVVDARPELGACLEAGVDVRLATACWGVYSPGPDVGWLPGLVAGLMDGARAWFVGADRIVVATGRRDMGLAFPGWDKAGVMGITAAERLARLYGALHPRRLVVLGTSADTLRAALGLQQAGCAIVAVVDPRAAPPAAVELVAALEAGGSRMIFGHGPVAAEGMAAVEALRLRPVEADGSAVSGPEIRIACDGVLLGIGSVPVVELLAAAGCRMVFDAARGGWVPALDADLQTSRLGLFAAGDCAGIWPEKTRDPEIAGAEGAYAASAPGAEAPPTAAPWASPQHDLGAERLTWVRASLLDGDDAVYVCQCEEVTAREILDLRPPRYLGQDWPRGAAGAGSRRNDRSLRGLLGDTPHPDQVKRLTRAGMGACQGRRCREQVAALLALATDQPYGAVHPASYRAPVRPMPLRLAATALAEAPSMSAHWDTWFGMPAQYVPFWKVEAEYRAATRPQEAGSGGE